MLHDIIIARAAVPTAWLSPSAMYGPALRSISLRTPTAFDLASTFPSAHPAARPNAANTGPKFAAHSTAAIRHAAPSTHTFSTRTTYAVLAHSMTGRIFARPASVSERLGTPQQLDGAIAPPTVLGCLPSAKYRKAVLAVPLLGTRVRCFSNRSALVVA